MPQTLMALLAMMTITLASVHQQRTLLESRLAMLDDEMEVMASGIALQAIEYIATKKFDEAAATQSIDKETDLTSTFPQEKRCALLSSVEGKDGYDLCNDLSDFNKMSWENVPFPVGKDTLFFEVTADIRYVDSTQRVTASRSFNKEVVVTVREVIQEGRRRLLRQPVRIARTLSYGKG